MRRKIRCIVLSIALLYCSIIPAHAIIEDAPIDYWYSDSYMVLYTRHGGSYYVYNYNSTDSTFTTRFTAAISTARSQWNAVLPFSISETSVYYAVNSIHGGTYQQLHSIYPDINASYSGYTKDPAYVYAGSVAYGDQTKNVYKASSGTSSCVVANGATQNQYKNTALHEMGHLFGWRGHSSNSNDVMYVNRTSVTTLTSRDKRHIQQIYNIFY